MAKITSKDTKPEMIVRRLCHEMGYRYRLHGENLPGKPDLVFRAKKSLIFVHGCFWHQHEGCRRANLPKSRGEYWLPKLARNVSRDLSNIDALVSDGWKVLVVWECETKDRSRLREILSTFLGPSRRKVLGR